MGPEDGSKSIIYPGGKVICAGCDEAPDDDPGTGDVDAVSG